MFKVMTAEYTCIYGISNPVAGITAGGIYKTFGKDTSILILTGKGDRAYWFVFSKMEKVYRVPNIPRFTNQDAEAQIRPLLNLLVTDRVLFSDLWKQRTSYKLVPLEEALYSTWTWGRFACIGDSIHKVRT